MKWPFDLNSHDGWRKFKVRALFPSWCHRLKSCLKKAVEVELNFIAYLKNIIKFFIENTDRVDCSGIISYQITIWLPKHALNSTLLSCIMHVRTLKSTRVPFSCNVSLAISWQNSKNITFGWKQIDSYSQTHLHRSWAFWGIQISS